MIKLGGELREIIEQGGGEVEVGKSLPWTVFDADGRQLMRKGSMVDSYSRLALLAKHAVYRSADDAEPAHAAKQRRLVPFFAIGEMMGRLNTILSSIAARRRDSSLQHLGELSTHIQVMCAEDADAALAAVHLDREGKYTVRHLIHGGLLVELVACRLGFLPDDRHRIICATLTANVGMLELQERLTKQETITPQQREEINLHPARSAALLRDAGVEDEAWLDFVLQHHECMDGSGYPAGLQGDEIHSAARLIALADIYHAKISDRGYRAGMLPTSALRQVFLGQGMGIDQGMAEVFIKELGVYPPGGFVKLANGELAVVTHRGQEGTSPKTASFISPRGAPYPRPLPRDTSKSDFAIRETVVRDESILITDWMPLWGY